MKSCLVHFLYTQDTASIPLIPFLVSNQNEFLDQCANSAEITDKNIVDIPLLTVDDVIRFDRNDLNTLIYTHCNHSYEMGCRSKIQYDMCGAEKNLINNIVYECASINKDSISEIEFSYVDDVHNSKLFSVLHTKINQV